MKYLLKEEATEVKNTGVLYKVINAVQHGKFACALENLEQYMTTTFPRLRDLFRLQERKLRGPNYLTPLTKIVEQLEASASLKRDNKEIKGLLQFIKNTISNFEGLTTQEQLLLRKVNNNLNNIKDFIPPKQNFSQAQQTFIEIQNKVRKSIPINKEERIFLRQHLKPKNKHKDLTEKQQTLFKQLTEACNETPQERSQSQDAPLKQGWGSHVDTLSNFNKMIFNKGNSQEK